MRALRFALVAALVSVSVVESSDAFARGAAGGAAGGGASGGGSGGASGGGGGGQAQALAALRGPNPPPIVVRYAPPSRTFNSCFKQDELYDRYGNPVVDLRGLDCYNQ